MARRKRSRRWGSIVQRDGRWNAVYTPHRGSSRRVWEPVRPNTSTRAEEVLAQRRAEIGAGTWVDPARRLTFASLAAEWMETMSGSWRAGTVALHRVRLERHALPVLGELDVRQVDGPVLQRLANGLRLGPRSVRVVIGTVRQVLRWGHRHGRVRHLPDLAVRFPALSHAEVQPFTRDEVRRILDAALEHRPLLMWAVLTGMRSGEIRAARWEHLDAAAGVYTVRQAVQRDGTVGAPKTGDVGAVWIPAPLLEALEAQRAQIAAWRLRAGAWTDLGLIFPSPRNGMHMGHPTPVRALDRACREAGVPRRRFHDCRHTCASLLIDQGETILTVARQLRHRDPSITLRVYAHLLPDRGAEAMARLAASIS